MGRCSWYNDKPTDSSDEENKADYPWIDESCADSFATLENEVNNKRKRFPEIYSTFRISPDTPPQILLEITASSDGEYIVPTVTHLARSVQEMKTELQELKSLLKESCLQNDESTSVPHLLVSIIMVLVFVLSAVLYGKLKI